MEFDSGFRDGPRTVADESLDYLVAENTRLRELAAARGDDLAATPTRIFLDVDEVLANWLDACFAALGCPAEDVHAEWAKTDPRPWDVFGLLGVDASVAWARIHGHGSAFWANLEVYPWAHELVRLCTAHAPTTLLTTASKHPCSYAGKAQWIARHFHGVPHLIGRGSKAACASPGVLLIDDSPHNCEAFIEAGGDAIVFPGHGNALHPHVLDPMPHIREQLDARFTRGG
jgi:5'(3')-deoxyribonucleotidase